MSGYAFIVVVCYGVFVCFLNTLHDTKLRLNLRFSLSGLLLFNLCEIPAVADRCRCASFSPVQFSFKRQHRHLQHRNIQLSLDRTDPQYQLLISNKTS